MYRRYVTHVKLAIIGTLSILQIEKLAADETADAVSPPPEDATQENAITENVDSDTDSTVEIDDADTETEPTEPLPLKPPKLLKYVEAPYPEAAFNEGLEAIVLSEIDIDETGAVVDVRIVEPVGHGFDEAALAAMKQFLFEPAMKHGVPIPARVTYQYRFFLDKGQDNDETSKETPPAPLLSTLKGRILSMEDEQIEGAYVHLIPIEVSNTTAEEVDTQDAVPAPAQEVETATDTNGDFELKDIQPGAYAIEVIAPGYLPFQIEETVESGETRELIYRLELEGTEYEVVVRGKRPMREVTRRVVTTKEITKIPGTGGDALRAVQNLPGVARASFGGGMLVVRGGSPSDSKVMFDSLDAPYLYHFGDLTSIINSDLLENIEFYPGNFSVRYGRATAGIIDVTLRAPKTDRFHGYIDVDVWDAGALLEGPISKNWSLSVSACRSYIDGFIKAAQYFSEDELFITAPRYYDFQVMADYHPSKRTHLKLLFYGTDDSMEMDWDDDGDLLGSNYYGHYYTYQTQLEWELKLTNKLSNALNMGFGFWGGRDGFGTISENWKVWPLVIRDEVTFSPNEKWTLRFGMDTELRWGIVRMKVPGDYGNEGDPGYAWNTNDQLLTFEGNRFVAQPALYAELEMNVLPKTQLIYGIRGDYISVTNKWSADPRFSVRYDLFPKTTLKAGIGLFHQPGEMAETDKDYGNNKLENQQAIHYTVGFEQRILDNIEVSVEGFYKDLRRLVTASDDDEIVERDGEMVLERFNNDGKGRVYGMEAEIKHHPTDRFFGWITYTLMRSERTEDGVTRLFDYDQTHILNLIGSYHIGWGMDIGLRFRLVSGNPYTPVIGSSYDADSDLYNPIYGKVNSGRMPLFHQLDLRFDKKWQWKYLALTAYLDVQNVYNYKNTEFYAYSYDYKKRGKVQGLPIIPSFGLKLEH